MTDHPVAAPAESPERAPAPTLSWDLPALFRRSQEWLLLGTAAVYSAGYATIGLLLLTLPVVGETIVSRRLPWRRSPLDLYLLGFVAVFVLSGLLSPFRAIATGSALLALLTIFLSYGILYRILTRDKGFAEPLLWLWFAGAAVTAALTIYSFRVHGGPQAGMPALGPNALGSTFLIALVIGLGRLRTASSYARFAAAGGVVLMAVALAVTLSRGAWIGGAAGVIAYAVLSRRRATGADGLGPRRTWPIVLLVAAALLGSVALLGGEAAVFRKKLLSITNVVKNRERVFLARSALAITADRPLLGSGLNTFVLIHPHPSLAGEPIAQKPRARVRSFAHNLFLNMAAEGGLLGLAAFMAVLVRSTVAGWRWYTAAVGGDRITSAAVLAAFIGLLVHQQFDGTVLSVHISVGLWLLLAVMVANEPAFGRGPRGVRAP